MSTSLCMIVRDEESNLRLCLERVRRLVDELVVVDTGSSDGTVRVATECGARVFDFPWCDDFAAARNESLQRATGDWVLWLDADDRLDAENAAKLERVIASLGTERRAYSMRCVSIGACEQRSLQTEQIRLFRRDERIRWAYRVHEQISPALRRLGHDVVGSDVEITHVGYVDAELALKKQARNLRLLDMGLALAPLDPFLLMYRGSTLLDLNRPSEAMVSLSLCRAFAARNRSLARTVYPLLVAAYAKDGNLEGAVEAAMEGRQLLPSSADLTFATAELLVRIGRLAAAEELLSTLLDAGEASDEDLTIRAFRARHLRGELRLVRGAFADAESDARHVVEVCPPFGQGWLLLADALIGQRKLGDLDKTISQLAGIPDALSIHVILRAAQQECAGHRRGALALLRSAEIPEPERATTNSLARRMVRRRSRVAVPLISCISSVWETTPGRAVTRDRPLASGR